jgi:hypothetical protein
MVYRPLFTAVSFWHLSWAISLLWANQPTYTTSMSVAFDYFGFRGAQLAFALAGFGGLVAVWARRPPHFMSPVTASMARAILLIPQQFLLFLSILGIVPAIRYGVFADGTVVPQGRIFIFNEQSIIGWLAFMVIWALIARPEAK